MRHALAFLALLALPSLADDKPVYRLDYHVTLNPDEDRAEVVIESENNGMLKRLNFDIGSGRYSNIEANGELEVKDDRAIWHPPEKDARLTLHAKITHQRRSDGYDARMTGDWAIFRGDDVVPAARVRTRPGARAEAYLTFTLPEHWSSVSTGWKKLKDRHFRIDNPERRFDRPTGWMIAGKLGTRREKLGDTRLAVSAPRGSDLRRMDIVTLATIVWPEMEKAFGATPPKIAIIGHGDPMWRGGLSGPNAMYLHADRPMVSENGTSTLIHELVHVVTRISGKGNHDWIDEGLAEFYAVELMFRAGAMTESRRERVMEGLADWGDEVDTLIKRRSNGATTARAVVLFDQLDREIREATKGECSLDDLTRELIERRDVDLEDLREVAESILGRPAKALESELLREG
ncbi:hypothetical protein [Marinimicrobium sp. C2-29]|uniref:hypothetical protein n=1 Tax=Marinimicrobium sp. C2-29 TaxID=3139825 RepID=UPI003139B77B